MSDRSELTGFPTVDKPWLKYYTNGALEGKSKKCTVYDLIYEGNKDFLNNFAISFFGNRITYNDVFQSVNECAKALLKVGVKRGDCINLITAGVPEAIYIVLACSRIGVLANFVNPLFDKEQMRDRINDTKAEWIFVLDVMYKCAEDILEATCAKNVVVIPIAGSFPTFLKIAANMKSDARRILKERHKLNYFNWKDFVELGKYYKESIDSAYIEDTPTVMVYSSGSTGASKGIVHTNESINATVIDSLSSNLEWNKDMSFLQMIPIWFSTGIVQSILLPMSRGLTVILEPRFNPEEFVKDIMKYEPTFTLVATSIWMSAIQNKKFEKADLSKLLYPFTGGEKLIPSSERELNSFLQAHKCKSPILKGYGMCELGGKVTDSVVANKEASVGIPMVDIVVGIFDPITNEELTYGKHGEIRVNTPAHMMEYFKNEKATEEYFWKDDNGIVWGCTGDIGFIDEDGLVYVLGRTTDNYTDESGRIIYLFDIEEEIIKDESVSQCKVVASKIDGTKKLVAHIVFRDSVNDENVCIDRIRRKLKETLEVDMQPRYYKIRTSMPVHNNGKRDVESLEKDIKDLIPA